MLNKSAETVTKKEAVTQFLKVELAPWLNVKTAMEEAPVNCDKEPN